MQPLQAISPLYSPSKSQSYNLAHIVSPRNQPDPPYLSTPGYNVHIQHNVRTTSLLHGTQLSDPLRWKSSPKSFLLAKMIASLSSNFDTLMTSNQNHNEAGCSPDTRSLAAPAQPHTLGLITSLLRPAPLQAESSYKMKSLAVLNQQVIAVTTDPTGNGVRMSWAA